MNDALPCEAAHEARPDRVDPRLLDLWLRVALARSYGPPVSAPLPEALWRLVEAA